VRVATVAFDEEACGFYRVDGPAGILVAHGEVEVVSQPTLRFTVSRSSGLVVGVEDAPEVDVLVLQRPVDARLVDSIPYYQASGIAVVVELDDDLEHLPPLHSQHVFYQPRTNPTCNWRHLRRACRLADLVTVSAPVLRRYAPEHSVVLPNFVPSRLLGVEVERDGLTVGWGGNLLVHHDDLDVTRGGVGKAVRERGARFLVVGPGEDVQRRLGLDGEPEATGVVSFSDYATAVARLDVGIAPLASNVFNSAKSRIKPLEYAALGVVPVASGLPEYRALASYLDFRVVEDRGRSWRREVHAALDMVQHGYGEELRERVRESFVLEDNAWRWLEAWELARENHGKQHVARVA
jgi:hypothetical protein